MRQVDLERELGEVSRDCSLQLFKNLAKCDISPWYSSTSAGDTTCSVQFLRYDPVHACFRTLSNAPRRFQGAHKIGLITIDEAHLLSSRLLDFVVHTLAKYKGYFRPELDTNISQIIRRATQFSDQKTSDIEQGFLPDDLYLIMPWAASSRHFINDFTRVPVREGLLAASKHPFTAFCAGIDAVGAGPSVGLTVSDILLTLQLLQGKTDRVPEFQYSRGLASKIALPSLSGGFQGITIANFSNLKDAQRHSVLNYLYQFGETIGQKCLELREVEAEHLLRHHDDLHQIATAFLLLLPPTEYIRVSRGKQSVAFRLKQEKAHWEGYHTVIKEDEPTAPGPTDAFVATVNGHQYHLLVRLVNDLSSLDVVLTRLRMKANVKRVTSTLDQGFNPQVIRRNDLFLISDTLERQIADGIKVNTACKALYLIENILRNYDEGQARLYNDGCRQFMAKKLGKPAVGYQVAGKAADRLIKEANRLITGLQFETPTDAILHVRWRPVENQLY